MLEKQINQCLHLLKDVLGKDLLGVYLFGSAIIGGLQKYSDVDLFVVINRATTYEEKAKLENNLLHISGIYMASAKLPIEITMVNQSEINPWYYPPHFDFQYGEWLRKKFESGNIEPWPTKEMPDLAILITQVLLANKILLGPNPHQLLVPIPYRDFMIAMITMLDSLMADLDSDTRNVLLSYARIWSTIETDMIRSKIDAADWVIDRLPPHFQTVMNRAKSVYMGEENENWDDIKSFIRPCADFILKHITKKISSIELSEINRVIQLHSR